MKRSLSLLALSILVATGCQATGNDIDKHWNERSIAPRVGRFFLGYDASRDGAYRDFQWERKQSINLTLRRHLFNHNPDNPNHQDVPSRYAPRPNHSLLPNPINYVHLEGLLLGLGVMGASGSFFPLPLDSILGTLEPGGTEEFMAGVGEALSPVGVVVTSPFTGWTTDEAKASFNLFDDQADSGASATVVRVR